MQPTKKMSTTPSLTKYFTGTKQMEGTSASNTYLGWNTHSDTTKPQTTPLETRI
jgi:hypothetical protein